MSILLWRNSVDMWPWQKSIMEGDLKSSKVFGLSQNSCQVWRNVYNCLQDKLLAKTFVYTARQRKIWLNYSWLFFLAITRFVHNFFPNVQRVQDQTTTNITRKMVNNRHSSLLCSLSWYIFKVILVVVWIIGICKFEADKILTLFQ